MTRRPRPIRLVAGASVLLVGLSVLTVGSAVASGAGKVKSHIGTGIDFPLTITAGPDGALWLGTRLIIP